jgi:hypothetical protein
MLKSEEMADPNSCWNKARPGERVFVLLERDIAVPGTIEHWCDERIKLGRNEFEDPQIQEALRCAELMRNGHAESHKSEG